MSSMAATHLQTDYPNWFIFLFLKTIIFPATFTLLHIFPLQLRCFFFKFTKQMQKLIFLCLHFLAKTLQLCA